MRWLAVNGRHPDFLSDDDLDRIAHGDDLARAYDLIVFPGHEEYVTEHEYDLVERYRDLGGNLAFLAANNFFWKITIKDDVMTRVAEWRDLGRPEAALIGVQYRANDRGGHRGPWLVHDPKSWLVAGAELSSDGGFGIGGIEIDSTTHASDGAVKLLSSIGAMTN